MDSMPPMHGEAMGSGAAAAAMAAAATPPSSAKGWLVPSVSASASASSLAAPPSFPSFYSLMSQSSLSIVQSHSFDATTLLRLARESVSCEEQVATSCLLIQAATLVQSWAVTYQLDPLQHERQVVQYVLDFYTHSSASQERAPALSSAASSDALLRRPLRRGTSAPPALSSPPAGVSRQAQWRASFALKLYEVLQAPEFPELQRWMMRTSISTLRLLVQYFWHKANLGLLSQLLEQVAAHNLGKHLIEAALTLRAWDRELLERSMTPEEQATVTAEFGRRIEQCAHNRTTAKLLKHAGVRLISSEDQHALQSLQWRQPSGDDVASLYAGAAAAGSEGGMSSAALANTSAAAAAASTVSSAAGVPAEAAAPMPMHFSSFLLHAFQQHALANAVQWNPIDLPPHLGSSFPALARTSTRRAAVAAASSGDDEAASPVTSLPTSRRQAAQNRNRKRDRASQSSAAQEAEVADAEKEQEEQIDTAVTPVRPSHAHLGRSHVETDRAEALPRRPRALAGSEDGLREQQRQVTSLVSAPLQLARLETSTPDAASASACASLRKRRRGMAEDEEGEHKAEDHHRAHGASVFEPLEAGTSDESPTEDASWRAVHANTDARIYPFNQAALPADLSSYGRFHVAHASRVGRALYYQRCASDPEQWTLQPVDPNCTMTVGAWHRDFLQPYLFKQQQGERIDSLIYLIDISVPHLCHQDLRAVIDICRDCDETGPLTLNHFVEQLHGRDIGMPDVQAQLYLSPPTQGAIFTPTHYDGHGSQASLHAVLFGGAANFNLVHTFPTDRHAQSPEQEAAFRRILGIAPFGQPQHLPHQQAVQFSSGKKSWDAHQEEKYRRSRHGLSPPSRHELHPGHVMLLPTGIAHNFKKVQADVVVGDSVSFDPSPMLGYAGDSTYIGSTASSVASNCAAMAAAAEQSRHVSQPPLCFLITGIIALCQWARRLSVVSGTSRTQREQVAGALPTLTSYVQLERQVLLDRGVEDDEASVPVVDVSVAANGVKDDSEWVCARCQGEVANLHGVSVDAANSSRHSYTCVYCLYNRAAATGAACLVVRLSFRFYTTMALEELVQTCSQLGSVGEETNAEAGEAEGEEAAIPLATAYQEREAQVALLESILPEGALLAGHRGKQRKSQQARQASFHLDWIHAESKLYLDELKKWIKEAALGRLDAEEKARLRKEADKAKAMQPVEMEIDGKAEADSGGASPSAAAAAAVSPGSSILLGPGALCAAVKRFTTAAKAVDIKQLYRIHPDQQAALERAVAACVLRQQVAADDVLEDEEKSSVAPVAASSAEAAPSPPTAALSALDAQVVRSIVSTLVVWPHYFEQLYAMVEAATTSRRKTGAIKVASPIFRSVAHQLEVYEFVRAAGLRCSNRVGTDSLDPDGALTVRDSIRVDSSIEEQAYWTVLGALVDKHPGLPFLHLRPQLIFGWSTEAGGSDEEMLHWCRAHLELLKSKKYLVFHWGQDHYCSLVMNLEMWLEGPLHERGNGTAAAAAAVTESEVGPTAAPAARPSRNKKAPTRIGEEDDCIYSSSIQCVPFIHMDTLPSGCHFLLEHSSFLASICRAFNTLLDTEWPVDATSLRSYVHLAGPPAQADLWSCGYNLLQGWSLLLQALDGSGSPLVGHLTPSRVTTLCAEMKDKTVEQLVQFTLGEFDAVSATVPHSDPSAQPLFYASSARPSPLDVSQAAAALASL